MFEGIFSGEAFQETLAIIQSEFLLATWETVYVTILATACAIIIGLLVIPFSPASLNMVEWSIVIGWLAIGLALMAFTNSRKK